MSRTPIPRVKVCCIQSEAEAMLASEAGARFVGLVGSMPSGPGPVPDDVIARIAASVPAAVTSVLLTSREEAAAIVDHVRTTGVRAVQLVRPLSVRVRREVREELPGVRILQVVHMQDRTSAPQALDAAEEADYLLLDSGRPDARIAELGGTGRTHDWALSARVVEEAPVPVFLAGGLHPGNVAEAVASVRPYGVDVCSGLRPEGRTLDEGRLREFMERLEGP
jgi:phosphoribosylanthranilate isomerase